MINGTGDSGVLLQKQAAGSRLDRFQVTRCGAFPPPIDPVTKKPYPRHPFYVAVPDVHLTDAYASAVPGASYVGQCFSVRCGRFTLIRGYGEGAPHIAGYFEQDDQPGDVYMEIFGSFAGDCAVWLASSIKSRRVTVKVIGDLVGNGPVVRFDKNLFLGMYEVI